MLALVVALIVPKQLPVIKAADDFLSILTSKQREASVFPFSSEVRLDWAFVPRERKGVALRDLSSDQREKLTLMLKTLVSDEGMRMIENVRVLEGVLKEAEGPHRDPDYYVTTVFGSPSNTDAWAIRYEGHHLSLNFTFQGSKLVSTTPQFFGANPATVLSGSHKGLRTLAKHEDFAFDLMLSLSSEQRSQALVNTNAPADIVTSNQRTAAIQADTGLPYAQLSEPQKKLLRSLVEVHAAAQKRSRADEIKKEGWDHVVFAWMGATEPGKGHYYRIQSQTYLIEFDNTQNNANHIHAVWRSFKGDFGGDALAEHYAHDHQHHR